MEYSTRLDLFDIGRRYVLGRAERIDPLAIDTEGTDVNLIIGALSYMAYAVQRQSIEGFTNLLTDAAEDDNLDRIVFDRYTVYRKGASAAVVPLDIGRPTFAAGGGQVPKGTVILGLDGTQYATLEPAIFNATSLASVNPVRGRAVQAGKEFQVGANIIRRFDKPNLLWDKTLQVNNPVAAAGGEPAETNDVFRDRAHGYWRAIRGGTLPAIEWGALTVPGVVSAEAIDVLDNGQPGRLVELFIADSSGVANQALAGLVLQQLLEWRAGGIQVIINTSRPVIVDVLLRLVFRAGVDTVTLSNNIRSAVVTYINSLSVNRPLLRNDLGALLSRFRADGLIPNQDTVQTPVGDLYPEAGTTLRTRIENVQISL